MISSCKIICLANSRKNRFLCFAGKRYSQLMWIPWIKSNWIRPVSSHDDGAITENEMQLSDGHIPKLLDIVKVPLKEKAPEFYHPENILISHEKWQKIGTYDKRNISILLDSPKTLWVNEPYLDRISVEYLRQHTQSSSLLLIKAENCRISRRDNTNRWGTIKPQVRLLFAYNTVEYNLVVTDIEVEKLYKDKPEGTYLIGPRNVYLCISLGVPFNGFCYKLVATIIRCD